MSIPDDDDYEIEHSNENIGGIQQQRQQITSETYLTRNGYPDIQSPLG